MLLSARARSAPRYDDGVIGHAWSPDLVRWEAREPICAPGAGFGQLEVVQVRVVDGQHVLVFTCHPLEQSAARREQYGDHSTWSLVGQQPARPVGRVAGGAVRGRARAVRGAPGAEP